MSEDQPPTVDERVPGTRPGRAAGDPAGTGEDDASGRYRRGAEIARGGMGRVVEAEDAVLGRTVALKETLELDADARARFEREVRITARLEHPSIVPVYDAGRSATGLPFYVMRRLTGRPLDKIIAASVTLDQRLTYVPNLLNVLDAVGHAHRRGIIHRDLKPANVLIGDLGETVVIDWGLAKVIGEAEIALGAPLPALGDALTNPTDATVAGTVVGTPGFMPPEQADAGSVDARSDVYALGATLYHLLAGAPPYAGGSATAIIDRTVAAPPPSLAEVVPGVPRELATIVGTAMARAPDDRYPDAVAMGEDLRRFLTGRLVAAHHYSSRERLFRYLRRHRTVVAVVTLAVIALAVVGTLSLRRILADRDRIATARATAEARRTEAEATARELRTLADGLIVDQARLDLKSDPTLAVALLKRLPADSPTWPAARAIVAEARTRGIAYALPGHPGQVWTLELAPDDRHLLTVGTQDGVARVHDLEARTSTVIARGVAPRDDEFHWAGRVIARLTRATHELALIDATDGTLRRVVSTTATSISTSSEGSLAWAELDGTIRFLHVGGTDTQVIASMPTADWIMLSPDASFAVIETPRAGNRKLDRVFHRTGPDRWKPVLELAEPPGELVFSFDDTLAAYATGTGELVELDLTGEVPREWRRLAVSPVQQLGYAGRHLWSKHAEAGRLVYRDHTSHDDRPITPAMASMISTGALVSPIGHGMLVIPGSASGGRFVITAPDKPPIEVFATDAIDRIVARVGCKWVVGATGNRLLVWSLDDITPKRLEIDGASSVILTIGPHHVAASDWGQAYVLDTDTGLLTTHDSISGTRGLVTDEDLGILLRFQDADVIDVIDVPTWTVRHVTAAADGVGVIDRDTLATVVGDVVTALDVGTGAQRELGRLGVPAEDTRGHHGWVVIRGGDRLLRTDGRTVDTVRAPAAVVAADVTEDGTVYAVAGPALVRWPPRATTTTEIARPTVPLANLIVIGADAVIALATDHSAWRIDAATGALGQIMPTLSSWPVIGRDGNCAVAVRDGAIIVADLVGRSFWSIPTSDIFLAAPGPSCDQIFAATTHSALEEWDVAVPYGADALRTWIEASTNARASDSHGVIEWVVPPG